ncbi:hypothetical protein DXB59_13225 [Ruminococcus sp. OM05-10BH]|nr:hypothetical protein DXB59_13225 [Ruminococcus sp. OM05-10BH]
MEQKLLFTNKQLRNMILPLVMEQFLLMLVGLSDTFIVSQCMGAGDTEQAEQYFKRLMKITLVISLAMCMDWLSRAVVFWVRFRRGKWKTFHVIS